MKMNKTHLIVALVMAILGFAAGFFSGKAIYDRPLDESVSRDTVTLHDTVPEYLPAPKDSVRTRYVTRYLPLVKRDTVDHFLEVTKMVRDTVEVEIPITSKHYSGKNYDAYVSGFEPSLDSIFVYNETQLITETITRTAVDQKHFFLDIAGGCEYFPNAKNATPFAELGLSFKKGRFGIGAYGGYSHDFNDNKATPYAKAKITYDIFSF